MPLCPAAICAKFFSTDRGLSGHLSHSKPYQDWIAACAQHAEDDESADSNDCNEDHNDICYDNHYDYDGDYDECSPYVDPKDNASTALSESPPFPDLTSTREIIQPFDDSTRKLGQGKMPYHITHASEEDSTNFAYPFAGVEEWGLARWLAMSGLPWTKIDK